MNGKFEACFESLQQFECPEWFRDAKFGIWSHWGPQSVPMAGDWYARNMYIQGTPQYNYHLRHFGHPSEFGYIDICKLWKAESFEPEKLMELYRKAGARYFVAQGMHHDNFFNYDSKVNRFNSVNIGPEKDIVRLWKDAADKYGMRFGITEHLGASYNWWYVSKASDTYGPYKGVPYDGVGNTDFYHENGALCEEMRKAGKFGELTEWLTDNRDFQNYWEASIKEMIDLFEPDLLYSDSGLPFMRSDGKSDMAPGLRAVSYLYNKSIEKHGRNEAVYTQKDRRPEIYTVGVLDIEKSQLSDVQARPWQTDTCIGNWFYDARADFKHPDQIIEMLVDIISKNGTMLLNILQRPDGSVDHEAEFILEELAKWFTVCGEAVHGTRPYDHAMEGDTRVTIRGFTEEKTVWNPSDYRFVTKGDTVYAYLMAVSPTRVAVIKTLGEKPVKNVRLLGAGSVPFSQSFGILTVKLPETLPTEYTNCLAIEY